MHTTQSEPRHIKHQSRFCQKCSKPSSRAKQLRQNEDVFTRATSSTKTHLYHCHHLQRLPCCLAEVQSRRQTQFQIIMPMPHYKHAAPSFLQTLITTALHHNCCTGLNTYLLSQHDAPQVGRPIYGFTLALQGSTFADSGSIMQVTSAYLLKGRLSWYRLA